MKKSLFLIVGLALVTSLFSYEKETIEIIPEMPKVIGKCKKVIDIVT